MDNPVAPSNLPGSKSLEQVVEELKHEVEELKHTISMMQNAILDQVNMIVQMQERFQREREYNLDLSNALDQLGSRLNRGMPPPM